ncbi:hypothetical protein, variant [Aphanomyces astaci]|nr:hypothetical protein, variant [Aphanomyces astaci]ETV64852.1 hypothetical protein, variant [Aphanomyces astaci]|eukprot:XP_009845670.1 hypothetical protein, variant [Aphanomyces astaci]
MGHFTEHLLFVAARDSVHVLKIQSLAESVYELPQHSHYAPLTILHTAINQPISPSMAATLNSNNTIAILSFSPSATLCQTMTVPSVWSEAITCLIVHDHTIVLGWSTGNVQIFDNQTMLGQLSDPVLTTSVGCMTVVAIPVSSKARKTPSPTTKSTTSSSTWGGTLLRSSSKTLEPLPRTKHPDDAGSTCVLAASGDGFVCMWRVASLSSAENVDHAMVTWRCHSTAVHSLLPFFVGPLRRQALVSITSDGHAKVWDVTTLSSNAPPVLMCQLSAVCPSRSAVTATCVIEQDDCVTFLLCGFESGHVAIYQLDARHAATKVCEMTWTVFSKSDAHQRRVSRLRSVPHPGQLNPPSNIIMHCSFVSASFDGHVIVWALDGLKMVSLERRYFEFHGPVLDAFVYGDSIVVTLPHEICRVKFISNLRPAIIPTKPNHIQIHTQDEPTRTSPPTSSRWQQLECHVAPNEAAVDNATMAEMFPDSLSVVRPPTQSPTEHELMAEAIRQFLASTHSEHQFEAESEIFIPASDVRRVYKIWRALAHSEPSAVSYSGKRHALFLKTHRLLPSSQLSWAQVLAALSWCNTTITSSKHENAPRHRYDAMGKTKAVVSFNSVGEKSVEYVTVSIPPPAAGQPRLRPVASVPPHLVASSRISVWTQNIYLPRDLQPFWRTEWCWCTGKLVFQNPPDNPRPLHVKCDTCHKKQHVVHSDAIFPARSVLSIVHQIYKRLQLDNEAQLQPTSTLGAIAYSLFKTKFGMQSVVELKLTWFWISVAEHSVNYAAINAFAHCCDLFHESPAVPLWLVQLYIKGYYWLQSHGLVSLGEGLPGAQSTYGVDVAHGDKHSCWEMITTNACRLCCQDLLVYPHVPPKFVSNVLAKATSETCSGTIEIHAFLSLWLAEWRDTCVAYETSATALFNPRNQPAIADLADDFHKLHVLLDCFVYYDRRRDGCVDAVTFTSILLGMITLWPPLDTSFNAVDSIDRLICRYQDHERDGAVCYLDMFSLLYIVALKTQKYLAFSDIHEFSYGYKLELDDKYRANIVAYMECSMFRTPPLGVTELEGGNLGATNQIHHHSTGNFHWENTLVKDKEEDGMSSLRMEHLALQVMHPAFREREEYNNTHSTHHELPSGPYIPESALQLGVAPKSTVSSSLLRELIDKTHDPTIQEISPTKPLVTQSPDRIIPVKAKPTTVRSVAKTYTSLYVQFPHTRPYKQQSTDNTEPYAASTPLLPTGDSVSSFQSIEDHAALAANIAHALLQVTEPHEQNTIIDHICEQQPPATTAYISDCKPTNEASSDGAASVQAQERMTLDLSEGDVIEERNPSALRQFILSADVSPFDESNMLLALPELEFRHRNSWQREGSDEAMVADQSNQAAFDDVSDEVSHQLDTPLRNDDSDSSSNGAPHGICDGQNDEGDIDTRNERLFPPEELLSLTMEPLEDDPSQQPAMANDHEHLGHLLEAAGTSLLQAPNTTRSRQTSISSSPDHSLSDDEDFEEEETSYPLVEVVPVPPACVHDYVLAPLDSSLALFKQLHPAQFIRISSDIEEISTTISGALSPDLHPLELIATKDLEAPITLEEDTPDHLSETHEDSSSGAESSDLDDDDGDAGDDGDDQAPNDRVPEDSSNTPPAMESTPARKFSLPQDTQAPEPLLDDLTKKAKGAPRRKSRVAKTRKRSVVLAAAVAAAQTSTPPSKTSIQPVKRREFLFSHPVHLNVQALYKTRSKPQTPQWTPLDASDDDDDDEDGKGVTHTTTYDDSAFCDSGSALVAGDICLSPRLDQSITNRWATLFESEEIDIHFQLTDALRSIHVDSDSPSPTTIAIVSPGTATSSHDTVKADIRSKTKRRMSLFRADRATRESICQPMQLQLGESVRDVLHSNQMLYFAYHNSSVDGIVTIKLDCHCDAVELYVSSTTTAPCPTDCDWRSSCLDTHDKRVVIYPDDKAIKSGMFYVCVGGLKGTEELAPFALCAMSSGQALATSASIDHVDELITQFHALANMVTKDMEANTNQDDKSEYLSLTQHYAMITTKSSSRRGTIGMLQDNVQLEEEVVEDDDDEGDDNEQDGMAHSNILPTDETHAFEVLLDRLTNYKDATTAIATEEIDTCRDTSSVTSDNSNSEVDEKAALKAMVKAMVATRLADTSPRKGGVQSKLMSRRLRTPQVVAYSIAGGVSSPN